MQQKPDATKNATGVDTSNFASLKADVDGLSIDKLEKSTKWFRSKWNRNYSS